MAWSASWRLQDTGGDGAGIIARSIGRIGREVQSPAEWAALAPAPTIAAPADITATVSVDTTFHGTADIASTPVP